MVTSSKPPSIDQDADSCSLATVLQAVSGKWALMTVGSLCNGPLRFNALRREIGGVSQKALTHTLRGLERDGLVHREVIPTVPVSVIYSLTTLGLELAECTKPLRDWSEVAESLILAQRRHFDEQQTER